MRRFGKGNLKSKSGQKHQPAAGLWNAKIGHLLNIPCALIADITKNADKSFKYRLATTYDTGDILHHYRAGKNALDNFSHREKKFVARVPFPVFAGQRTEPLTRRASR